MERERHLGAINEVSSHHEHTKQNASKLSKMDSASDKQLQQNAADPAQIHDGLLQPDGIPEDEDEDVSVIPDQHFANLR